MRIAEATAMLARTPTALDALLRGVPDDWARRTDGPGSWSAYDIVGHLHNGEETDWLPRIRTILAHGAEVAFPPVDREAMLSAPPLTVDERLDRFAAARTAGLAELSTMEISGADLDRTGQHPVFGTVTLGQLLATWVAHDLTHIAQVSEVLARHYRTDVGPWRAYLPALDRI